MAFPASNGALSDALEGACRTALQMKSQAQAASTRMAAGNVPASYVLDMDIRLRLYREDLDRVRALPGIGTYAQEQLGDGTLNVAAEFSAMLSAIDGVVDWIRTNFPKDVNGYLLARTWGVDGPVEREFTPAQTAGLRTQLDALAATVV